MSKMRSTDKGNIFFGVLVGITAGVIVFFFFELPFNFLDLTINPELSFEIDPTNILSLIVTSGILVFVLRVLQRKDDGDRVERDLLISYFSKYEEKFSKEIHRITTRSVGIAGSELGSIFMMYGMSLQSLLELAKSHPSGDNGDLSALNEAVTEVRELLTNLPRENIENSGIYLKGGSVNYSPEYVGSITTSMGKFRKSIFNVISGINRY